MKQKYLLIGAVVILFILIIVTSLVGNLSKKTSVSTPFQEPTPYSQKTGTNNQIPIPNQTPSKEQTTHATMQNRSQDFTSLPSPYAWVGDAADARKVEHQYSWCRFH